MVSRLLWLQWRDIGHPWSGGAEVYMHEVCRRLSRKGIEVHAVTSWFPGLKRSEEIDGYTVERIGSHDDFILHVPRILKHYSRWADVIVEDTSKAPLMTPLLRPRRNIAVVAVVHHLNREIYFHEIPLLKAFIVYTLESIMPSLYTHLPNTSLIAVSESTKQELIKLGANPSRVFIVPNAINGKVNGNPHFFNKDPRPTLIYLSRIKRYKQPHHALLAFREALEEVPDARLIVAGKGTELLSGYVKRLGIEHAVEIYGEVDEETKMKLLCRAWVLIQTSKKEGFGIVVLEAAACRTPAVAYNVPGLRDSVKHMETGILVEPGNIEQLAGAIVRLLTDEKLRSRLAESAYMYAQSFSWDNTAETFLKVVEGVAHG
ncbi:glycosyl transferase, group 1 [Aeropyrum pernix]|uniref:Glycosyl transferase, group 1 n=1 Tax=Aeropyrum pernix TaxID=56636 RepID=A0A401HBN1_AERPX|nr:glycosyltransferase family 4 protein [Aeropyrum pernix]GBF09729.1 glycosyl transferase, group 1 [Aeropyrum pernix]